LCAIGTCAIGLVRYRELCQFFVCYRVGALSHRALTGPSPNERCTYDRCTNERCTNFGVQMNGVQMNGVQMNGVQMNGVQISVYI